MVKRAFVNVATDSWVGGQERLQAILKDKETVMAWRDHLPNGSPPHREHGVCAGPAEQCVPYAFKAYALKEAVAAGFDLLIWADACIVPVQPLEPLWERIERDGYWMSRQGYTNYQWTADSAYKDLFPGHAYPAELFQGRHLDNSRAINRTIPHVVATTFGIDVRHVKGRVFLDEYFRLASETRAFCGPWQNSAAPRVEGRNTDRRDAPCGPPDVDGHRHDQTAASVIAWRLGFELTSPPDIFSYRGGETDQTILVADGAY